MNTKSEHLQTRAKRQAVNGTLLTLVAAVALSIQCGGGPGGIEGLVRYLIQQAGWVGAGAVINCTLFQQDCGYTPPPAAACPVGFTRGRCECTEDVNGKPTTNCSWFNDASSPICGRNNSLGTGCERPGNPYSMVMGYESLPEDSIPANIQSIAPQTGNLLDKHQAIVIRFNESMDPASLNFSNNMSGEVSGEFEFSRSADMVFNDTLTVRPANGWSAGARTLGVSLKDTAGNSTALSFSYHVLADGQPPTPSFSSCVNPGECTGHFASPYSTAFVASGGVAPYTWRTINSGFAEEFQHKPFPPGHDVGVFQSTGVMAGPATSCVCSFQFTVCVRDALGQESCKTVNYNSNL